MSYADLPKVPSFGITSESLKDGATLSPAQTSKRFGVAGGKDESPHVSWSGAPAGTKSFVLTVFDPDAPRAGGYWHWALVNVPAGIDSLPAGAGVENGPDLPAGAFQLKNDAGFAGYLGAAPPPGHGPHRYIVAVHAVDVEDLGLGAGATLDALVGKLASHSVGRASITGRFERR
ncbi:MULTISPECIES: YbhB/YbcL family Raf kinase inhibitor-like protein [Arthrobacter]|uniref:YbhB/YbcL family Raf kinase inhibitor-like protein n=1 Tax=Arthrobacter terricola TaxID=2547396 RepID=A0A4R5KNZ0_9MICC|nr:MULTISPECIES: YbhB/YbcL family Raf kinase inhibitor-like protein [Arthrobacter]MBT8160829.1 YbhB/YbcL family Raf kinase inhibitor-like protein [Arthrobacter sp. GN70]TDF97409.1 YbhB/YbcL family Raf kinase inhibitor-like protein [Arthrobacter terricola]